ncbi:diaminopimelate epimerase [Sphaerisporangium melleum]|uniref:Diaminopimelate epimerase n=1 Tax=Sphaerisporangium melleum TaxID=321316 RepID=A0A917R148_9ACTN|nr:diaminopimelate epimerase [Sphaerisporangium melleum]GGK82770.1 diaminopimelate epimerase [Sphaerisporangium melleum]GII69204.1 diaminopimelate epimerase [Sphaerisporangium melleum]
MRFVKGHGTQNDFVILPDPDGSLDLHVSAVAGLCDRRTGIGADGVLRAVPTKLSPEAVEIADRAREAGAPVSPGGAEWFMDYRNADGSMAEMCGNGLRVFARYLVDAGLADPGEFDVVTRAGVRRVRLGTEGDVTIDMGMPRVLGESRATLGVDEYDGLVIDVGNPHLACVTGEPVGRLDLSAQPGFDPAVFPQGVNIELLNAVGERRVVMRVYERGCGETPSCGTGTVAAAVAAARLAGESVGTWTVEVPGGLLTVTLEENTSLLTGPAVLVAAGDIPPAHLA